MINREQAIDIIKAEKECVCRQGRTGECCRDDLGCGACDLVQKDVDIIEAYDMAITALKEETICPILSDDEVKQPCIKSPCGIERPHGEWIRYTEEGFDYAKCSACKWDSGEAFEYAIDRFPFCPNCGASMSANDRQVTGKLNSEIERSKSEIVPDYRDGWRLREGEAE